MNQASPEDFARKLQGGGYDNRSNALRGLRASCKKWNPADVQKAEALIDANFGEAKAEPPPPRQRKGVARPVFRPFEGLSTDQRVKELHRMATLARQNVQAVLQAAQAKHLFHEILPSLDFSEAQEAIDLLTRSIYALQLELKERYKQYGELVGTKPELPATTPVVRTPVPTETPQPVPIVAKAATAKPLADLTPDEARQVESLRRHADIVRERLAPEQRIKTAPRG